MDPDFVIGGPARDEDFWFRAEFLDNLRESLKKQNVLLLAPRRMGKTSVMYRLFDEPPDNTLVVHINVEHLDSPEDFIVKILNEFHEEHPDFLRDILLTSGTWLRETIDRVDKFELFDVGLQLRRSENPGDNWRENSNELIRQLRKSNKKVLIIVDELPDFILNLQKKSGKDLEAFLHWFRVVRTDPKNRNIRWLTGGSVNITCTLDNIGKINLISDFQTEILPPFTREEVGQFVTRILNDREVPFDIEIIEEIIKLLGSPIPLFLQLLTQELHRHWKRNREQKITLQVVQKIYHKSLLGEQARDKFLYFRSRINEYYDSPAKELAWEVLDYLANREGIKRDTLFTFWQSEREKYGSMPQGSKKQDEFNNLLFHLSTDFYIEVDENQIYDFSNTLLKEWWKRNYSR
ncbi:MAG: AAA family ATPase [Proteobacteria bacterium]|nr:AAA family ATPase [Pseudomonadota bacterium]